MEDPQIVPTDSVPDQIFSQFVEELGKQGFGEQAEKLKDILLGEGKISDKALSLAIFGEDQAS